jgi:hypothetical protein
VAYLTDPELKDSVASALNTTAAAMNAKYSAQIADANEAAQAEIKSRLAARGYTAAQVLTWARLEEFNRDLGIWFTFARATALDHEAPPTQAAFDRLDRRLELDTVTLLDAAGDVIELEDDATGAIITGTLSTSYDTFVRKRVRVANPSDYYTRF